MIANMSAYGLARRLRPLPIYEALLDQDGIHLPSHLPPAVERRVIESEPEADSEPEPEDQKPGSRDGCE